MQVGLPQSALDSVPASRARDHREYDQRASSRSFCTACGSTGPSSSDRRRRLPRNAHEEIIGFPRHCGKSRPCRDGGGGEIVRFFASVRKGDRACNIDPPASSYAIMRRASPTAERTVGPARMIVESLTPRPGIREQSGGEADIKNAGSSHSSDARSAIFGGVKLMITVVAVRPCR